LDIASIRRIKLQDHFLLRIYFQSMCGASVMIQLGRGSLLQISRALDIASSRRIKLLEHFLLRIFFQSMRAASVMIQRFIVERKWLLQDQ
jgi:hypothetical protein